MGGFFAKALEKIMYKQQKRFIMVGLDAAGKTTILYKLKLGEVVTTIPTIGIFMYYLVIDASDIEMICCYLGFNVETVQYKNISFTVFDMGGRERAVRLWRMCYPNTQGIIFVIDSNDKERMGQYGTEAGYFDDDTAKENLHDMFKEELLKDVPMLILANKQV